MVLQPLQTLNQLEGDFLTNYAEVEQSNKNKTFGWLISSQLKEQETSVSDQKARRGEIVFKLFGFIPIKKINVNLLSDESFYVGGVPIGLSINSQGAIVIENDCKTNNIKEGDIITEIEGQKIDDIEDISDILQQASKDYVSAKLLRKNKEIKATLKTYQEDSRYKLGLWVKDGVEGVGTLTFASQKTREYGALGHAIVEGVGGNIVPVAKGSLYDCSVLGINKGEKNKPGELRCAFAGNMKKQGSILENSKFGIKGVLNDTTFVDENRVAKLAGRLSVKPGKAKIVSSVSGIREEYDIEIIKNSYQKSAKDKSLIFRVKDKRLLELTGGIVQGMSGSPILQDGKIVGAVTHVFTSDPTKGYGVYVDWML